MTYHKIGLVSVSLALFLGSVFPLPAFSLRELFSDRKEAPQPETRKAPNAELQQKQADFLLRLRRSDPEHKAIQKAAFNKDNELGLVLDPSMPLHAIPPLSKALLEELAKTFPGQDLTVVTYAGTNPPVKIGTARLDARTGDMTYTPEHSNL